jgi:hypothetical protein
MDVMTANDVDTIGAALNASQPRTPMMASLNAANALTANSSGDHSKTQHVQPLAECIYGGRRAADNDAGIAADLAVREDRSAPVITARWRRSFAAGAVTIRANAPTPALRSTTSIVVPIAAIVSVVARGLRDRRVVRQPEHLPVAPAAFENLHADMRAQGVRHQVRLGLRSAAMSLQPLAKPCLQLAECALARSGRLYATQPPPRT